MKNRICTVLYTCLRLRGYWSLATGRWWHVKLQVGWVKKMNSEGSIPQPFWIFLVWSGKWWCFMFTYWYIYGIFVTEEVFCGKIQGARFAPVFWMLMVHGSQESPLPAHWACKGPSGLHQTVQAQLQVGGCLITSRVYSVGIITPQYLETLLTNQ